MSLLVRRTLLATPRTRIAASFSTSALRRKTATESVKDGLKTVDRAVADKLVDGIELGESVADKAKEVAGMSTGEVQGKASEVAGEVKGKASEVMGDVKGKTSEVMGEAKGKANEAAGQAKGKAAEVEGKM